MTALTLPVIQTHALNFVELEDDGPLSYLCLTPIRINLTSHIQLNFKK